MPTLARTISRACFPVMTVALLAGAAVQPARAQSSNTTFFVTSTGIGNGANLGGLAGADNHCQTLAQAAGAGARTWRAYLSTQEADGKPAVNARDRIGKGPWQNSKGVVIAKDVAELHGANNLTKQTALTEKGDVITALAISRTATTCSRGRSLTAPRSRRAKTAPARTGQAARRARRCWAMPTARDCATMTRRNPGTARIPRADRMAAAPRPTSGAPAAMA